MQNPFLQTNSSLTPKYTKSSFFRQTRSKPIYPKQNSFKSRHKQHNSLLSIYAENLFEKKKSLEKQHAKQTKEILNKEQVPLNCKDNNLLLYTIQNKNNKNKRIQSTINSVNNYTEELRMTLLNQYKTRKQRQLLRKKQKFQRQKMQKKAFQKVQNPQITNHSNSTLTQNPYNDQAFKTINLLYKAIIDSSFHKRKKQQFQVQANRLPIINRRESKHKKQILMLQEQQQRLKIQNRRTFIKFNQKIKANNNFNYLIQKKDKLKVLKDNIDIFPWKSDESEQEDN